MISEARFTAPRPDCPHPEWWTSVDDESTEREVTELVAAFVRALQPEIVVESGTAWGQTAEAIGAALRANGHGRLITYEIDPTRAEYAIGRVQGLPVEVRNETFGQPFPGPVDLAWIDGHIDRRVGDIEAVLPFLSTGGVIGVHDTGPQHGITEAVDRIGLRSIYLRTPRGVTFCAP